MTAWKEPPADLTIDPSTTHLWLANLPGPGTASNDLRRVLSDDESRQADQFKFAHDAQRYLTAHSALRLILARYTGLEARQLTFKTNPYGKPELTEPTHDIRFNLSHSGNHALIGVACGRAIGVDIELKRSDLNTSDLANRFFSPREVSDLQSLPPKERADAFFNCWTRKEAFVKACGLGLSLPLNQFDVSCLPHQAPALIADRHSSQLPHQWTFHLPPAPSGYAAAVAVEGKDIQPRYWAF